MIKLEILRGLPGSGKSSYAAQMEEEYNHVAVFSADDFFGVGDDYDFKPELIGEAHKWNMRNFEACLRDLMWSDGKYFRADVSDDSLFIVDNTNTTFVEMAFYVGLAQVYDIPFELVWFKCPPETSKKRNSHGVPDKVIDNMAARFQGRKEMVCHGWKQRIVETD